MWLTEHRKRWKCERDPVRQIGSLCMLRLFRCDIVRGGETSGRRRSTISTRRGSRRSRRSRTRCGSSVTGPRSWRRLARGVCLVPYRPYRRTALPSASSTEQEPVILSQRYRRPQSHTTFLSPSDLRCRRHCRGLSLATCGRKGWSRTNAPQCAPVIRWMMTPSRS